MGVAACQSLPGVDVERLDVELDVSVDAHSRVSIRRQVEHSNTVHHQACVTQSRDTCQSTSRDMGTIHDISILLLEPHVSVTVTHGVSVVGVAGWPR